jgi:hypothetical protein
MSGYLPAGANQVAMDRLLDDEDPDMEWDSVARRWVPTGTNDEGEEQPVAHGFGRIRGYPFSCHSGSSCGGNVLCLVPVRDPGAIAASLDKRDSLSPRASLLLWHRYMTEIVQDDDVKSTAVFLNYEQLLADPLAGYRSLCSVLDHGLGRRPPYPDDRPSLMAAIVEPRLPRSCSHAAFPDNPLATRAERTCIVSCLDTARGTRNQPTLTSVSSHSGERF